jgi:parallel beta-helix repeat protein
MKAIVLVVCTVLFFTTAALSNQYVTPGTGVKYTLDDLVTNSGGRVTLTAGIYYVSDTISINTNDTLTLYTDATIKYAANTFLGVRKNGVLLIDPPNNVTFTADNLTSGYLGVKIDSSNASIIRKLTLEYAVSFRINDCNPTLDSCILQFNNHLTSTSFGNGAVSLFRASPLIKNCRFINNKLAAIQGGGNISNAPKILNNYFFANVTNNANVPQINLGATSAGADTVKIIGNTIIGASVMSGGIGFLPIGNAYAIINGNIIRKNRYGITFNGGANINAVISYNLIDSNNIQNNPNLGGSGIAFSGGSATSQQNSIVTGNIISNNLWGITIQNRSKPNLGNLSNADTTDDGKNQFYYNTNSSTPFIDLYNNSIDNISAENNFWNTHDLSVAETKIFHQVDNASLGLVDFDPIITSIPLPVSLTKFDAVKKERSVLLNWQTETEINTAYFNIQKSTDGRVFTTIGKVNAAGNTTSSSTYSYSDLDKLDGNAVFYRLQIVDKDGKTSYSNVKKLSRNSTFSFRIVPNPANHFITLEGEGIVTMKIVNLTGQTFIQQQLSLPVSEINISTLRPGNYVVYITDSKGNNASQRLIVQ